MKATFETLLESIGQGDIDRLQARTAACVATAQRVGQLNCSASKCLSSIAH